ncbi:hypothetical protein OG203_44305 [Nocardia sp. NBC_01499]|uniref:hypothetical protein n=1 Tax=Nocardia sp. NBC_01499 TaxID=2903597 RepID=UPI003863BBF4
MSSESVSMSRRWVWAPITALLLFAPIPPEILTGSTSFELFRRFDPYVAEMLTYGCAALLARAVVRHKRLGWGALLTLAVAYAVAQEFLIDRTALLPIVGRPLDAPVYGGHALGVNWLWTVWAVGAEAVGPIIIATLLIEVLFPRLRTDPWIGRNGAIITTLALLYAGRGAWRIWKSVEPVIYGRFVADPAWWLVLAGGLIVAVLVVSVLVRRPRQAIIVHRVDRPAPGWWLVGVTMAMLSTGWYTLELFIYRDSFQRLPAFVPYIAAGLIALLAVTSLRRWSAGRGWDDRHRLAVAGGTLIGCLRLTDRESTLSYTPFEFVVAAGIAVVIAWAAIRNRQALHSDTDDTPAGWRISPIQSSVFDRELG